MNKLDIAGDPKLRAAYDALDDALDAWSEHFDEVGLDRAHQIALIGEHLALRLGFHVAALRLGGDENVGVEDGAACYLVVSRELSIATNLCLLQQGERPIERVRDAIAKATTSGPSIYGRGATWALDMLEQLTRAMIGENAPTV